MLQPMALLVNSRVVVGAQLEQKLEALDYRVKVTDDVGALPALAAEHKPLVVLADLEARGALESVAALIRQPATSHIPVLGYAADVRPELQSQSTSAGVSLVATDAAVLQHLKPLLDQLLHSY
jgi:CheY-like chemotaxis protein